MLTPPPPKPAFWETIIRHLASKAPDLAEPRDAPVIDFATAHYHYLPILQALYKRWDSLPSSERVSWPFGFFRETEQGTALHGSTWGLAFNCSVFFHFGGARVSRYKAFVEEVVRLHAEDVLDAPQALSQSQRSDQSAIQHWQTQVETRRRRMQVRIAAAERQSEDKGEGYRLGKFLCSFPGPYTFDAWAYIKDQPETPRRLERRSASKWQPLKLMPPLPQIDKRPDDAFVGPCRSEKRLRMYVYDVATLLPPDIAAAYTAKLRRHVLCMESGAMAPCNTRTARGGAYVSDYEFGDVLVTAKMVALASAGGSSFSLDNLEITKDSESAELFFVPMWLFGLCNLQKEPPFPGKLSTPTPCKDADDMLQKVMDGPLWQRRGGADHMLHTVLLDYNAEASPVFHKFLSNGMVITSDWRRLIPGERLVTVPFYIQPLIWLRPPQLLAQDRPEAHAHRRYFAFMVSSAKGPYHERNGGLTQRVRTIIADSLTGDPASMFHNIPFAERNYHLHWNFGAKDKLIHLMRQARFCMVPRGDNPGSKRFYSAILSGCIPVVLSDAFVLPFASQIDWANTVIRIPEQHVLDNANLGIVHLLHNILDEDPGLEARLAANLPAAARLMPFHLPRRAGGASGSSKGISPDNPSRGYPALDALVCELQRKRDHLFNN